MILKWHKPHLNATEGCDKSAKRQSQGNIKQERKGKKQCQERK